MKILIKALFIALPAILPICNPLFADSDGGVVFDHSLYAKVLQRYVVDGGVNYQELKQHRGELDDYVRVLEGLSLEDYARMSQNEKMAFWVNAYNAITLQVIIDHYPLKRRGLSGLAFPLNSIRQIPGVWDDITRRILGKETALNEIEHQILRKEFKEPRVHFALVCASIGCPKLREEPYVADRLEEQLDGQVRAFMSDPEKAQYEQEGDVLYLSPIFKWFADDFKAAGGRIAFVRKYFPKEKSAFLLDQTKIKWLDYDWSLNEIQRNPEGMSGG